MINIDLFRVDYTGDNVVLVMDCPTGYEFTTLHIGRYYLGNNTEYDLSSVFDTSTGIKQALTIPVENIGGKYGIFTLFVKAEDTNATDPDLTQEAICSDVSMVYDCMRDDLFAFGDNKCDTSYLDNLSKKFIILFAHQEAIKKGEYEDAIIFYDILSNCFSNCEGNRGCKKCGSNQRVNSCNCGR